jgi:multidrug efflux pump subunit AcrA (membrane-fusion protein)
VVGVFVLLLAGYLFIRWWNRDVVSVKTALVVRGPIEEVISASGSVKAPVYDLDTKLGGKIASLLVDEGDRVVKGEVLAELDNTARLVSPGNGIVAKINYLEGETVPPGMPAIAVVNYGRSWVEAQIDEIDVANVKIGDKVKITSDVFPEKVYAGKVSWIAPLAELRKVGGRVKLDEESYVFPCKIRFEGKHNELKINMQVNIDITARRKADALLLPREAVASKDDTSIVFLVRRKRVCQTKIDIGIRSFASLEATAGVSQGDLVAISNVSKLKDRGRVKIER